MSEIAKGLDNGLTNYGDQDFARYLRRSFAKSMGYTSESLDKPIVGICYTDSGFNNCHRHFPEMLEAVKRGVLASGALPIPFPMISHTFSNDLPGRSFSQSNFHGLSQSDGDGRGGDDPGPADGYCCLDGRV